MEQDFGSECSKGCESGWTFYLGHSTYPSDSLQKSKNGDDFICRKDGYEDDDMSMVSDASSGPPLVQEQEKECCNNNNNNNGVGGCFFYGKRQKIVKEPSLHRKIQDLPCFLDDTASSPFFNFSNNNSIVPNDQALTEEGNNIVDYSQGYSTTYFEGKSTFQDHFGFLDYSVSGSQWQENQLCPLLWPFPSQRTK